MIDVHRVFGLQSPGAVFVDAFPEHLETVHLVVSVEIVDSSCEIPGPTLGEGEAGAERVGVWEGNVAEVDVVGVPLGCGEGVILICGGEGEGVVVF